MQFAGMLLMEVQMTLSCRIKQGIKQGDYGKDGYRLTGLRYSDPRSQGILSRRRTDSGKLWKLSGRVRLTEGVQEKKKKESGAECMGGNPF